MFSTISRLACRTAVAAWLNFSSNSFRRSVVAHDSPHVHAPGANPDRVLIAGDGASAGVGVRTHDLGLPGYLARAVSRITGRATDVDILVTTTMTASDCLTAISALELSRFDLILLSLGGNEALTFVGPRRWALDMERLLDYLELSASAATKRIVLSIPYFGETTDLPRLLSGPVDRHAARLNAITAKIVAGRPNVTFLPFAAGEGTEPDGAHSYSLWADHLAPAVSRQLQPLGARSTRTELIEETSRQRALDAMGLVDMASDDELDRLTASAKELFGVPFAVVTLIDNDHQSMASAIGIDRFELPRSQAFCDVTIRRSESLAIEDAQRDPRYSHYDVVQGDAHIRFYAGYPIESQDGYRIGALCVMDVEPHCFTRQDSVLLRQIAQQVQRRLWRLSEQASPGFV